MFGQALARLADIANCVNGDFHVLHLNIYGEDFDRMHKVLKKYYEQAAEDYDTWAEAALMFDDICAISNPNESANRVSWISVASGIALRSEVIKHIDTILDVYLNALLTAFININVNDKCYKCVGVANTLQTRIEYWSKERAFFNYRRF